MMQKLLSVIIPSYNMEQYLPRCLDSLVAAGAECLSMLDVIVVNDGSKDRTSEIAHDYERRYPDSIRVIDKPNGHYGSAVNAGLKAARGSYVKNLDADDMFTPDGLMALLSQLATDCKAGEDVDLYLTAYDHINEQGETTYTISYDLPEDRVFGLDVILSRTTSICMHAFTWRVKLLRNIGYRQTEGISYSDWEWILYPMLQTERIRYMPVRVYRYSLGREGQSVSASERCKNAGAWDALLDRAFTVCRTKGAVLPSAVRSYLLRVTIGMAQMQAETAFIFSSLDNLSPTISELVAELEAIQAGLATRLEDEARLMKRTLNIPYLRVWRKLPIGKSLWVLLLRYYLSLIHWGKRQGIIK